MVLLLPPLMLHGLPYHNSIIKTFSDLRSCRWISGIWKIRGSCRQRDHHTLRCSGTTLSRTLCKWVVNALDRRLCVLTSCVGTGTGSAAEVSKVWSDPTWSTSSGFSAGHHCVSNSCPAAPRWLPEGGNYVLSVRLDGRLDYYFFHVSWILWK